MKTRLYILLTTLIIAGLTVISCEGPARTIEPAATDAIYAEHAAMQNTLDCTKQHPCNRLSPGFDPAISGEQTDLDDLAEVLRRYTTMEALTPKKASQVMFVYGIGHGEELYGPFVSDEVVMVSGEPSLIGRGHGPIVSAWEAFSDPLLGFRNGEQGIWGTGNVGFGDPINGVWGNGNVGFEDPALGLNAIWGNGNVTLDPDAYGLVLFSMSVGKGGAGVLHNASVVPFHISEQ